MLSVTEPSEMHVVVSSSPCPPPALQMTPLMHPLQKVTRIWFSLSLGSAFYSVLSLPAISHCPVEEPRVRMAVGLALPRNTVSWASCPVSSMCSGGDRGDSEPQSREPVSANVGPKPLFSHCERNHLLHLLSPGLFQCLYSAFWRIVIHFS